MDQDCHAEVLQDITSSRMFLEFEGAAICEKAAPTAARTAWFSKNIVLRESERYLQHLLVSISGSSSKAALGISRSRSRFHKGDNQQQIHFKT